MLDDALLAARRGEGRLVEVAGEPGIGKTRLLEEVRRRAAGVRDAARHLRGLHRLGAVQRLARAARAGARPRAGTTTPRPCSRRLRAEVEARAPALVPWLPLLAIPLGVRVPADARGRAPQRGVPRRGAARRRARRCCRRRSTGPALLQFEQAHHMDAASADLLRAVVDALPGRPWLVMTTRRDVAAGLRGARRAAGRLPAPAGARPGADARARGGG